jgi:plastocyanin
MHISIAAAGLLALSLSWAAGAADLTVTQKGNEFSVRALKVKAGDSVDFKNDDPHFHNVFSLSDVKSFDLGSYPQGQSRKVKFEKEGTVEIECAIHPQMKLTVEVAK